MDYYNDLDFELDIPEERKTKTMNITILSVAISTLPAKKPGGKPYQVAEVAFKNNTFGGAVQGKKITSYSKAYPVVSLAQPGEAYEITTEKNGEFVEWVAMQKTVANAPSQAPVVSSKPAVQGATAAPRSNYETPEERAQRQVYIIRQSSLSTAVSTLAVGAKSLKPDDVLALAKRYESYVFSTGTGFDDIPDLDASFVSDEPNIE